MEKSDTSGMAAKPEYTSGNGLSSGYHDTVDIIRQREYQMLKDVTYLDHAGTTPYSKSLIEQFSREMMSNLFGNPHSASGASQLSTRRIDDIRLRLLRFLCADPSDFDIIFVANATAGMKLLLEALRDCDDETKPTGIPRGFWYGYHHESHTSLIGLREAASAGQRCFESDEDVEAWLTDAGLDAKHSTSAYGLFAYPAQSNMTGRRLPLRWCGRLRRLQETNQQRIFTLLDAAAYVSTAPLDLSNADGAPDFTVLSFYKIFGFPDLGALIIRKACGHLFQRRKYFGGGTVDMVVCSKESWHAKKIRSLHDQLEDGTLPIHSIIALDSALDTHERLYGSMQNISKHTSYLAAALYKGLSSLRHGNGERLCEIYKDSSSEYGLSGTQGPVLAFNIRNGKGGWVSNVEVEKLATIKNIHIRTGGLCNPGGIAHFLRLTPGEMKRNLSGGQRCETEFESPSSKPIGAIRVSLGAMSNMDDVNVFLDFIKEFFTTAESTAVSRSGTMSRSNLSETDLRVKSLTIYPIKSCAGWHIPPGISWDVMTEGLAWDREWCLVHLGTGAALNQKQYPKMALIRPSIDLENGVLRVRLGFPRGQSTSDPSEIIIPLASKSSDFHERLKNGTKDQSSRVCGDAVTVQVYTSDDISRFFSSTLGVPCTLARFPAGGLGPSSRHSKVNSSKVMGSVVNANGEGLETSRRPILLSNESPILIISQLSLNLLNQQIEASGGQGVQAEAFRANIVIDEVDQARSKSGRPYMEDQWEYLQIGQQSFKVLGACRRCHMVCIDQKTAQKSQEPFVTLAKTRRSNGKVFFGQHICHLPTEDASTPQANSTVAMGDRVKPLQKKSCDLTGPTDCVAASSLADHSISNYLLRVADPALTLALRDENAISERDIHPVRGRGGYQDAAVW
ncbi:MAG: hypothetical protein M1816_002988 [Peltula sp. TS41687]|nr:MAG: hypothetical protein M1816_002988 [Peltula sp. TS41687]